MMTEKPKCCAECCYSDYVPAFDMKTEKVICGYACGFEKSFIMNEKDGESRRAKSCKLEDQKYWERREKDAVERL